MQSTPLGSDSSTPARPTILYHNFPAELTALKQWIVWRLEERDDDLTKVPYQTIDVPRTGAMSNNPATWSTFEKAVAFHRSSEWTTGIGFMFSATDPFFGIDLDKCRDPETGVIEPWALDVVRRFQTYTEVSVSGRGIHIIGEGSLPPGGRRKGRIETYDRLRYFTMTGKVLDVA